MITMEALALAHDTIRIALKTAGYRNVDSMSQFERASALLDMAQEYIAIKPYADATHLTDYVKDNHKSLAHYGYVYDNIVYKERTA